MFSILPYCHGTVIQHRIYSINRIEIVRDYINRFPIDIRQTFRRNIKARKKARFTATREARNREEAAEHVGGWIGTYNGRGEGEGREEQGEG